MWELLKTIGVIVAILIVVAGVTFVWTLTDAPDESEGLR